MATTAKAVALMREFKDKVAKRLPSTWILTDSLDADGNPVLTLAVDSSWASGDEWAVVRIKPEASIGKDVFGNTQTSYGPHIAQICVEGNLTQASALPATSNVNSVLTNATFLKIMVELFALGCKVECYREDTGSVPSTGDMVAAKLQVALWPDQYHALTNGQ